MLKLFACLSALLLSVGVALAFKPPDPIAGFTIQSVAHNALTVSFDVPALGKVTQ